MRILYVITGAPGAGKTTYGLELARQKTAAFLDIDTVTETLVRAAMPAMGEDADDRDSPRFKATFREPIYDTLFAIAKENLLSVDVVIAGPFTQEQRDPHWLDTLAERMGTTVEAHHLSCPPETRRQRLADRANPRDAAKLADWENHLKYYGEEQPPAYPHLLVES